MSRAWALIAVAALGACSTTPEESRREGFKRGYEEGYAAGFGKASTICLQAIRENQGSQPAAPSKFLRPRAPYRKED